MSDLLQRRSFLGRFSAGALAVFAATRTVHAERITRTPLVSPDDWLKGLSGKHRQVFDAVSPNGGFPMGFAKNFLDSTEQSMGLTDKDVNAVVVLRHFSIPYAFNQSIWDKYHLSTAPFNVTDPMGKALTQNPLVKGSGMYAGWGIQDLQARGVVFGVCNLALGFLSGMRAAEAGVTPEAARAEWVAAMVPGVNIIPSGVWGVNNAQEHGCTYCFAG